MVYFFSQHLISADLSVFQEKLKIKKLLLRYGYLKALAYSSHTINYKLLQILASFENKWNISPFLEVNEALFSQLFISAVTSVCQLNWKIKKNYYRDMAIKKR